MTVQERIDEIRKRYPMDIYRATAKTVHDALAQVKCRTGIFLIENGELSPVEFKRLLHKHFLHARVECVEDSLLGVVGLAKPYRVIYTIPIKDEAQDLERVLKSFRGVSDEMVIGVDRSTTDNSREIAARYAEEVFEFTWERDISKIRNACLDRCRGRSEWILMTEGHEHLEAGVEELLHLDAYQLAPVVCVTRRVPPKSWYYPWLYHNDPAITWTEPAHDRLVFPPEYKTSWLPQIVTYHERTGENADEVNKEHSMFYLESLRQQVADEPDNMRALLLLAMTVAPQDQKEAFDLLMTYLRRTDKINTTAQGHDRYVTTMYAAELITVLAKRGEAKLEDAEALLWGATKESPLRTEHWLVLGDLFMKTGRPSEALRVYGYASTAIGYRPATGTPFHECDYSWMPCNRMAQALSELGNAKEALYWARRAVELLPSYATDTEQETARSFVSWLEQQIPLRDKEISHAA